MSAIHGFINPECWVPTMRLRWIEKTVPVSDNTAKKEKILQQMWQSDTGSQQWEDIEVVTEP